MNKFLITLIPAAAMMLCTACGGEEPPAVPDPVDPAQPEVPVDDNRNPIPANAWYNGIVPPAQWPPQRNYASDIRAGMQPFYLASKPAVICIENGRQLFVDNFLIASTTLVRKFHYPEYHAGGPVLVPDKDWEKQGRNGGFAAPFSDGVWYDESDGRFKMWYMAGGGAYATDGAGVTCYAESADGINWTKPSLNVVPGTNIVYRGTVRDASTVWIDKQTADASQRYKMFEVSGGAGKWAYHYLTSADGKAWRDAVAESGPVADRSTVYYNPFRQVWAWSMRHNVRLQKSDPYTIRARDYMEHPDPAAGNRLAKADLKNFWFGPWPGEQKHPLYDNNDGSPGIYNHDAIAYESIMLGLFSVWQGPENDICNRDGIIKRNQIMLGYSRDGYSWTREDMNPFLAVNEAADAWNNANLQSAAGSPLIVGDRLYFYLSGRRMVNGAEQVTTGLATLRRDGFASMEGSGELLTEPLWFGGEHFFVNADVKGTLRVELLDRDGNAIEGFGKNDCVAVTGDNIARRVEWKNHKSLKSLEGKIIRVRFHLDGGDLYAFWISEKSTGESAGYTAGGGPGLDKSGIDK